MSSINFRIYGEQIYGFTNKYLTEYISPEFDKEEFLNKFNSGQLSYENISIKKAISINLQINLDELTIEKVDINIPNETENLSIYLNNIKAVINLLEINNDDIEKIIINERKALIEKFIDFTIKKIEKKESSKSFIEGLIENFINRAINGLSLDLNNIELIFKCKKYIFIFIIEKISYSEENGIKLNNISILFEEDSIRKNVINKFSINIEINQDEKINKKENEENNEAHNNEKVEDNEISKNDTEVNKTNIENKKNILNISITNFEYEENQNVFYAIKSFYDLFNDIEYKKTFLRHKKLIQFHKPKKITQNKDNLEKNEENGNKANKTSNYISQWYYAIKTVIKLQKYIGHNKDYIFDLIESSQIKISKKYLEDNEAISNLLLPTEICLLKSTKDKVEKQLLDNKKGGGLTKAFSFFFGGGDDDDNKELTEDERNELDSIYTDDYIMKYLLGLVDNKNNSSNPLSEKLKNFINNLSISINIQKIEYILNNLYENGINNKCNLFIKDVNLNFNLLNKNFNFELNISDIGTLLNESLFSDRFDDVNYLLQVKKESNNDLIQLNLGFNNIILNEEIFIFLLTYYYSIKLPNKIKLFHKIDYYSKINQDENIKTENVLNNSNYKINVDILSIIDKCKISNIPSLTLLNSDNNKIEFNLDNCSLTKNKLNFTLNIQDSFGIILDNYDFNFILEKNFINHKFIFHLEETLNITLSKNSTFFIFITILKLNTIFKNLKNNYNINDENKNNVNGNEEDEKLFYFNYVKYKDIDIDFKNIFLDIIFKDINIEINEKKCSSFLSIKNLILKYEKKDLFLKTEKIEINTDYLSTVILYIFNFKSKDFEEYEKIIENNLNINKDKNDKTNNELVPLEIKNNINSNNNIKINYNIKIRDILTSLNLEIDIIIFSLKIGENTIFANIYNIQGKGNTEDSNILNISLKDINLYIEKDSNMQKLNILKIKSPALINYYFKEDVFKLKITNPILNIFKSIYISLFNDLKYLIDQINFDEVVAKYNLEILDSSIKFSIFNFTINYIYLSNFDDSGINTLHLKVNDFLMRNEKNINIIEQKELLISLTNLKNEDNLNIKFNDSKINISQHDISFLISLLQPNIKEKFNNTDIVQINSLNLNNKSNNIYTNILEGGNNENKIKSKKEHSLEVNSEVHNINISFCLDDYTKKSDLKIKNIIFTLKISDIKNNQKSKIDTIIEYKVIIDRILLKYFDDYNNEIIILNYNQEKKVIKHNENNNQVEIICNKEITKINLNKNEIILRIDCFFLLYNFFMKALPLNNQKSDPNIYSDIVDSNKNNDNTGNKKINNIFRIQVNFNKSRFQLQTSFDAKENLNLIIDDFNISYNPLNDKNNNHKLIDLSFSQNEAEQAKISVKLGYISASIISEKQSKELFYSEKDFISIKCGLKGKATYFDIYLGILVINISYQDIISFLKAYLLNKILIDNLKSESDIKSQFKDKDGIIKAVNTIVENKKSENIKAKLNFSKIDFTFVDNSYGSYQPFLNGCLNKLIIYYNNKKTFECNFNLLLFSYNYISCKWEPILENLFIKLKYAFDYEGNNFSNSINIDINDLLLNLSDMAISSTMIILHHWLDKFQEDEKKYSKIKIKNNNFIQFNDEANIKTKITNNILINYTGMNLNVKYYKYEFICQPKEKLELEYIINWDHSISGLKKISISINDKNSNNFNNNKNKFDIFIDKLGIFEHYFERNKFLIVENTLSKDRKINISIYSQIIIKNKTYDDLKIKFINEKLENPFILLKSNSIIGIPFQYYNNNTCFIINLINKNNLELLNNENQNNITFHLSDFLENDDFNEQQIFLENKFFYVKLINKLNGIKEILITFQYSIINCLPCEIIIENQKEKKSVTVKKFTQHFLDFYSDLETELIFKIKVGKEYFQSANIKYFKIGKKNESEKNNYTTFYNSSKTQYFKLSIQYNKNKNTKLLIIYSESILYNCSGIDFKVISKNKDNPLCFNIDNKLYLMSSEIDDIEKAWIQLQNEKYISNRISLDDIIEGKPFYNLNLQKNDYKINLIIKTMMSYISIRNNSNFKENIMTMIYKIYPTYRIINLMTSKNILIREEKNKNNYIIINSLKQVDFNFFEKGKNVSLLLGLLNYKDNKCSPLLKIEITSLGIFSYCIENTLFNIEVKDSSISGIIDVFIIETNFENAKIIIENLSDINFTVNQEGFDKYLQFISKNDKQILKLYSQSINNFIVRNNENNKSYKFSFNSLKEEGFKNEIDNIIFIKKSNGMKMKLIIFNKSSVHKIQNNIMKLNLILKINRILISVIADNEFKNKKLRNYERNELLLLNLSKFVIKYNLVNYSSFFDNNKVNLNIFLDNFALYNQISKYGKFSLVCQNISSPMSYIETELFQYQNSSMSKINNFKFKMSNFKLNIDPHFIEEVINFFENILYRMEIINFNVDDIFLHRNRDFIVNRQKEKYQKENSICYGTNISFPEIDINFELTEIGLGKLLKEKVNCSQFFIWLGYGLVGKEQNIFLNKPYIKSHLGSFQNLIQKIVLIYKDEISSEITNIGLKGLFGQIQQFFSKVDKTDEFCDEVRKHRMRPPRAFYGKYKYFKIYDKEDANYIHILEKKYNFKEKEVYCNELIKDENHLYFFTFLDLLILNKKTLHIIHKISFSSIDKVIKNQNEINIYLIEKGKKSNNGNIIHIQCENIMIAEKVSKLLNNKSKYNIN